MTRRGNRCRRERAPVWRRWWRRDDGAFTPMVAVIAAGLFTMVGLSVDGGGRMRALEHADNIAAEAARAGGQVLDLPLAIQGTADLFESHNAAAAADNYLANLGVAGHATVINGGTEIYVEVKIRYQPLMLGLIDLGPWTETGTATAELVTR